MKEKIKYENLSEGFTLPSNQVCFSRAIQTNGVLQHCQFYLLTNSLS